MRAAFYTLGCKLNQSESEALASSFKSRGFFIASPREEADIYIVNTCTVTGKAEQKARRMIRKFAREHPTAAVVVTGCYAQLEREEIAALAENVLTVGQERKADLLDLAECLRAAAGRAALDTSESEEGREIKTSRAETMKDAVRGCIGELTARAQSEGAIFRFDTDTYSFHSRAFLKIQDGCDYRCTYCRVPLARGGSVSLLAGTATERARELEESGYGEVVLTGVNITSYRDPADSSFGLADLIERILRETETLRLRLSSLEPEMINRRLLSALQNPRVQPHFHIPVQSGSDRILAAVRRPYRAERVLRAVADLRTVKDDPFIAADIIAGLPGETEEDFTATCRLIEDCRFTALHVFPFSPRPGTEAEHAGGRVPERIIGERAEKLRTLGERLHHEYVARWRGRETEAVLEKRMQAETGGRPLQEGPAAAPQTDASPADNDGRAGEVWSALSANYLHLEVRGVPAAAGGSGTLCRVRIAGDGSEGGREPHLNAEYTGSASDAD
jgi:threonylcarbamoyladenosine tRNA methylthiotransferase MtaB